MSLKSTVQNDFEPTSGGSAVDELLSAGTSPRDVTLLRGTATRDIRDEPMGSFTGTIGPDARVGTFAGKTLLRSQAAGGWVGDPDNHRQGSFADRDL